MMLSLLFQSCMMMFMMPSWTRAVRKVSLSSWRHAGVVLMLGCCLCVLACVLPRLCASRTTHRIYLHIASLSDCSTSTWLKEVLFSPGICIQDVWSVFMEQFPKRTCVKWQLITLKLRISPIKRRKRKLGYDDVSPCLCMYRRFTSNDTNTKNHYKNININ